MQVVGTKEAFTALISQRGIYKLLDVERAVVSGWKIRMKSGDGVSLDKMEEMLMKAGASVAQEKIWEMPNNQSKWELFLGEVRSANIGDIVSIDLEDQTSWVFIKRVLIRRAEQLNCQVMIDRDETRTAKFIEKP